MMQPASESPPRSSGLSWKLVILMIVLALIAGGVWTFYRLETWPQRTARDVTRAFAEIAHIQPKITVHDHVIFEQTSPVLELAVVTRETHVEREMEHEWLGSKKRIRLRGTYSIRAGFDLTQPFSVKIDDRRISTELPPAKILAIDPLRTEVLAYENGFWNKISPTELEAELQALPALARRKAAESGLLKEAVDTFSARLRDQLGGSYDLEIRTRQVPEPLP
jgi:hypothetical protein